MFCFFIEQLIQLTAEVILLTTALTASPAVKVLLLETFISPAVVEAETVVIKFVPSPKLIKAVPVSVRHLKEAQVSAVKAGFKRMVEDEVKPAIFIQVEEAIVKAG